MNESLPCLDYNPYATYGEVCVPKILEDKQNWLWEKYYPNDDPERSTSTTREVIEEKREASPQDEVYMPKGFKDK